MSLSLQSLAKDIHELQIKVDSISCRLPEEKPSRFVDTGDGTILDKETNLVWMKQDDGKRRTWKEAKEYCENNQAKLLGNDWRLPTVKELISLIDYDKHGPAISPFFTQTQSAYYWSSTPYSGGPDFAWSVGFSYGYVDWHSIDGGSFVRPVRQNS